LLIVPPQQAVALRVLNAYDRSAPGNSSRFLQAPGSSSITGIANASPEQLIRAAPMLSGFSFARVTDI
jgi:hypothetical protein